MSGPPCRDGFADEQGVAPVSAREGRPAWAVCLFLFGEQRQRQWDSEWQWQRTAAEARGRRKEEHGEDDMATVRTAPSTGRSAPHPGDTAGSGRRPEAVRGAAGRACAGRRRSERECFDASLYNPNNKSIDGRCLSLLPPAFDHRPSIARRSHQLSLYTPDNRMAPATVPCQVSTPASSLGLALRWRTGG